MGRCPTGTVPGGCQSELQTQVNPHRSAKAHSNSSVKHVIRQLWRCLDPTFMSAAPHYGLRYGCAPATGNFQRLRGRPPLVSPLKSCMGRSFTAVTRVQILSGTPTSSALLQLPMNVV